MQAFGLAKLQVEQPVSNCIIFGLAEKGCENAQHAHIHQTVHSLVLESSSHELGERAYLAVRCPLLRSNSYWRYRLIEARSLHKGVIK